jgi:hypothetical protein
MRNMLQWECFRRDISKESDVQDMFREHEDEY